MEIKQITLIGGSASTNHGLPSNIKPWIDLIRDQFPKLKISKRSQVGLSFVNAASELSEIPTTDLLILQFAISVGWPRPLVRTWFRVVGEGESAYNPYWLQQPRQRYSGTLLHKLKRNLLFRSRNGLKYLLFILGLYKAKTSYRELEDQIDLVLKLAKTKARHLIWIQQKPLQTPRIAIERKIYMKYFKRIKAKMEKVDTDFVSFINLENIARNHDYYIYDGVHLSEMGHAHLANLVSDEIKKIL